MLSLLYENKQRDGWKMTESRLEKKLKEYEDRISEFEKKFIKFLHERHAKVLKEINESTELKPETEKALKAAADDFTKNYWKKASQMLLLVLKKNWQTYNDSYVA